MINSYTSADNGVFLKKVQDEINSCIQKTKNNERILLSAAAISTCEKLKRSNIVKEIESFRITKLSLDAEYEKRDDDVNLNVAKKTFTELSPIETPKKTKRIMTAICNLTDEMIEKKLAEEENQRSKKEKSNSKKVEVMEKCEEKEIDIVFLISVVKKCLEKQKNCILQRMLNIKPDYEYLKNMTRFARLIERKHNNIEENDINCLCDETNTNNCNIRLEQNLSTVCESNFDLLNMKLQIMQIIKKELRRSLLEKKQALNRIKIPDSVIEDYIDVDENKYNCNDEPEINNNSIVNYRYRRDYRDSRRKGSRRIGHYN